MRNKKSLLIILIVLVVGAGIYYGVLGLLTPEAIVAEARRDTAVRAVTGTVTVEPEQSMRVVSTGNGFLEESKVQEGAIFEEGDEIARIDAGTLPFDLEKTRLELKEIKKDIKRGSPRRYELQTKRKELNEARELLEAGRMPESTFEKKRLAVERLEVEIADEEAALEARREQLDNILARQKKLIEDLTVNVPMTGQITRLIAFPGDLLSRGSAIADIISLDKHLVAEVNQDDIEVIEKDAEVKVRLFAYGNRFFKGHVKQILPRSDESTQRFTVYVELHEPPERLLPGLTGEAVFMAGERENTIVIPRRALLGHNVFVVVNGRAELRKVEPGFLSYSEAEILEGITDGEKVIVENLDLFRDGDRVNVTKVMSNE